MRKRWNIHVCAWRVVKGGGVLIGDEKEVEVGGENLCKPSTMLTMSSGSAGAEVG